MIDWLKYLPIQLRSDTGSTDCRGPNFSHAQPIHLLANGCDIHMQAPRHRSKQPEPPLYWENKEGMAGPFRNHHAGRLGNDNWCESALLARRWSYWTAWFAGSHAEMSVNAKLLRRAEGKEFEGASLFHPRSFEFALANYLNVRFGHLESRGKSHYRGPVDWQVHEQLPIFSVSFRVEKLGNSMVFYAFPVSDDTFFLMSFGLQTIDEPVVQQMEKLARNIITSVSMELSPQAKAQIERVKADCPDMSLSENFAPLKWPIAKEDIEAETPSGGAEILQRKIEG